MGIHKKVKFPIEVTKGKADDLYRLRFMRKSELEPNLRHSMRQNNCQMGRQLDVWFKEQLYTIGSLNKEQEKLFKSRIRLRQEIRKSKRQQYARHQEAIRTKLNDIKIKMVVMKVIQKFRDNVRQNKLDRGELSTATMQPKENKDSLRISGNRHSIHGYLDSGDHFNPTESNQYHPCTSAEYTEQVQPDTLKHKVKGKLHKGLTRPKFSPLITTECITRRDDVATAGRLDSAGSQNPRLGAFGQTVTPCCGETTMAHGQFNTKREDDDQKADDAKENIHVDDTHAHSGNSEDVENREVGKRHASSQGARMETIPEEPSTDVSKDLVKTGALERFRQDVGRLNLLHRSHSKQNMFDDNESVPLLPDVHNQMLTRQSLPDPIDQNECNTKESNREKKKRPKRTQITMDSPAGPKKKIFVKLPTSIPRENSANSVAGIIGSPSDGEVSDVDFAYGFSETADSENNYFYSSEEDEELDYQKNEQRHGEMKIPEQYCLTLMKYKSTLRRKEDSGHVQSLPAITNISPDIPNSRHFHVQNPFALQHKERSFFIKPLVKDREIKSAREQRHLEQQQEMLEGGSPTTKRHFAEIVKEKRNKRTDEYLTQALSSIELLGEKARNSPVSTRCQLATKMTDIAVFGRKADGVIREQNAPPNTPSKEGKTVSTRISRSHLNKVLLAQKRAKLAEQERIHDIVMREPIQTYERCRNGKLKVSGSPRLLCQKAPSMKDQYHRDKMLRQERDSIIKQRVKMRKFIEAFEKERFYGRFSPVSESSQARTPTQPVSGTRKTIGGLLFKVFQPEQSNNAQQKQLVPNVNTTSLRVLKECRYLREYKPYDGMTEEERMTSNIEKMSSWNMRNSSAIADKNDRSCDYRATVGNLSHDQQIFMTTINDLPVITRDQSQTT